MRSGLAALSLLLVACGGEGDGAPDHRIAPLWPVLLSHSWSNTADTSFLGDQVDARGRFEAYGVKRALEAGGAVVYQPDKLAYASHEVRGRLLYRKCAGPTVAHALCEAGEAQIVDGVEWATRDYCAVPEHRQKHGFGDAATCHRELRFNVICHSQGCPDSRYMMVAVRNRFSGEPMYRHVASWTSIAGANKGTALADWILRTTAACLLPGCRSPLLDLVFLADSLRQDGMLVTDATDSVIALSQKYMLDTADMNCDPARRDDCRPSFNALYPLPEDPSHPILYQSFSLRIDDIDHPCHRALRLYHEVVRREEGANDGYISVESQQFATYGRDGSGGRTPVIVRGIEGISLDPARSHPGLDHMAPSSSMAVGMDGVSCAVAGDEAFRFSRVDLYRRIVAELAEWGY